MDGIPFFPYFRDFRVKKPIFITERFVQVILLQLLWKADFPTFTEWREFEEKLTPGTLRNFIRVQRTLVEIGQNENKGKRQAMFDEMLAWINELHPFEKEGLTKQAYEIVKQNHTTYFGAEIAVPVS